MRLRSHSIAGLVAGAVAAIVWALVLSHPIWGGAQASAPPRCSSAATVTGQWWANEPAERGRMLELFTAGETGSAPAPAETEPANVRAAYMFGVCHRDPAIQDELFSLFLAAALEEPDPTEPPGPIVRVSSLTQNGITIRLEGEASVATYANGDFAIVKPWPRVLSITPAVGVSGWRIKNGAQINPRVQLTQGFDSAAFGRQSATVFKDGTIASYNDTLNVARQLPLTITAPSSLVCCWSVDAISTASALVRPQIKASAVFTFVDAVPPAGAFRPPYCGTDKSPWLRSASGAWALKSGLPSAGRPNVADLIRATDGPFTGETYPNYPKRYLHPLDQMPDYGAEISALLGEGWLVAMDANLTEEQRAPLLANLVQAGIDWEGVRVQAQDNHWDTGGGHAEGVLETILLAGQYLGNQQMLGATSTRPNQLFNIRATRYRVPASYVGTPHGYGPEHVGMSEWGNEHQKDADCDDVRWDIPYPAPAGASPLEVEKANSVKTYRAAVCLPSATANVLALWIQGVDDNVFPLDPTLVVDVQRRWRYEAKRRNETGQRAHYFHPWSLACWDAVGPKSEATYPRVP